MKIIKHLLHSLSIVAVFSLFFISPVAASDLVEEQDTAVATNLELYGGLPTDITVDPTGDGLVVYMTTYTPNGIYSSSDAGVTWNGLPVDVDYGAGKSVIVDPDTGDAYVVIGDDLLKSVDNGTTWTSITANLSGQPFIVGSELAWVDGTLLVAIDNGEVEVSNDGGNTFTNVVISEGTSNDAISISGDSVGNVYAVMQNTGTDTTEIFMSDDHGATWELLDVEAGGVEEGSRFYDVSVDPLDDNHIVLGSYHPDYNSYHSFDAGVTWTALLNGDTRLGGQEAVFDGVGGLYLGTNYTNDASIENPAWSQISTETPLSSVRGDLYAVDPTHPTTVYSNTALGVAKSEDGGANWVDSVEGITAVKTYAISQANDKDVVWLGANGGLAKTTNFTDDTIEWDYPISTDGNASSIYAVWVKPNDAQYVVTGSSNFLYYTEDGGTTWVQADAPDFTGTVDHIIQSPNDDDTLYALYVNTSLIEDAYNGGVFMSTDAGQTWTELNFPTTLAGGAIAVANNDGSDLLYVGIGLGGSETGIYMYNGVDWEKLEADFGEFYVNDLLVDPEDNSTILASFEAESTVGSLYKTTDAGDNWEQITDGLDSSNHLGVMATQPGDTSTLYLAGQDGGTDADTFGDGVLYKSTNGGDSWSVYYRGKKQEFFYALLFDGLIAGNDRGVFDLKSLGKMVLKSKKKAQTYRVTVTLKDAATSRLLKNKKLTVYRKKNTNAAWKKVQTVKTTTNGKAKFTVPKKSGSKIKVVWKPKAADRAEYTKSTSRILSTR